MPDAAGTRPGDRALAVGLGLAAFALYLGIGLSLHFQAPRLFHYLDQVFDADVPARVIDLTRPQGPHHRTHYHPLLVVLLNPLGFGLRAVFRGLGLEQAGRVAAIVLCAAAGGLTVGLFSVLLGRLGLARLPRGLWTLVFALSASQLVFASVPESWAFSGLALVGLFVLGARPRPPRDGLVLAGAAAFGMAVTNLAAAVLVRARWLLDGGRAAALRGLLRYVLLVLLVTALVGTLGALVYPGATPFYRLDRLARDDRLSFVRTLEPSVLARRGTAVAAHLLFFNLAAPRILVTETGTPRTAVDFPDPSPGMLRPAGVGHAVAWAAVLVLAASALVRGGREPLLLVLALWVALQAALHLVFGTSLFLYSCQWTSSLVALAAAGTNLRLGASRAQSAIAAGLALLQAATNGPFLREVLLHFSELR